MKRFESLPQGVLLRDRLQSDVLSFAGMHLERALVRLLDNCSAGADRGLANHLLASSISTTGTESAENGASASSLEVIRVTVTKALALLTAYSQKRVSIFGHESTVRALTS
ncbi:unnamed protein product, partial [Amoebophrya sp. A25]|eukprot:GSA25T00022408001.1